MKNFPITPDQIKTISSEIRARERDRLDASLPNTTVLNTIVAALGIGPDFRTFKASFEKSAGKTSKPVLSNLIFLFESNTVDSEIDSAAASKLLAEVKSIGMQSDLCPAANGYSILHATSHDQSLTPQCLADAQSKIKQVADALIKDFELTPLKGSMFWQTQEDEPDLIVNFRYHDNDQVASTHIHEAAWRARHQLGLTDEDAIIVLGADCDIDSGYHNSDISAEDVMREVVFFTE